MIEKDIDNLGRLVIPIKFRRELGIEINFKVLVALKDGTIIISPIHKHCALCGKKIETEGKFRLCRECILKIKDENL